MVIGPVLEYWKYYCAGEKVNSRESADVVASRRQNRSLQCLRSPGCFHDNSGWLWSHTMRQIASYQIWSLKQAGRWNCICQTWIGLPWGEFWSSGDGQNIIIHPMYSSDNVDALLLDVWGGADHVLQPLHQGHLIIFHISGKGSCIFQTWNAIVADISLI